MGRSGTDGGCRQRHGDLPGPSGFSSWDPSAATVAWNQIALTVDADLLVAGANETVVTNLADAANFGCPPYILLADASLLVDRER